MRLSRKNPPQQERTAPAPITARPLFHDKHWYVASEVGLHRLGG